MLDKHSQRNKKKRCSEISRPNCLPYHFFQKSYKKLIEVLRKFETLSYLPPFTREQLLKEIEYLRRKRWVPCLEFELEHGFVYRENHKSPGYYDGRYWTMWKLPMFGCNDVTQVLKELDDAVKTYPNSFVHIIRFDNVGQVQCISFIAYYKPSGY